MSKISCLLCLLFILTSCKKESVLEFSDDTFYEQKSAIVSINVPKAMGNSPSAKNINTSLKQYVCSVLNIDASKEKQLEIGKSVQQFNESYVSFKKQISNELSQDLPLWEAHIDGEVTFQNENLISIAMNSSINTGALKNNLKIEFLNYNPSTGKVISTNALVNDFDQFKELVKKYYNKELLTGHDNSLSLIKTSPFKLPESIGFSDSGVIIFYNSHELLMPSGETIEFTIPYETANPYLLF